MRHKLPMKLVAKITRQETYITRDYASLIRLSCKKSLHQATAAYMKAHRFKKFLTTLLHWAQPEKAIKHLFLCYTQQFKLVNNFCMKSGQSSSPMRSLSQFETNNQKTLLKKGAWQSFSDNIGSDIGQVIPIAGSFHRIEPSSSGQ